ncbi:MAG: Ferrous-iron efflux pump FieF [bacterium ADurb.Bin429]|nr:MAG: Ferrous-iron efflux pump FieF [bacterium ADurb.Bin429]
MPHERRGLLAVNLGLVTNIFLAVGKTAAGVLGGSAALLADGINSVSDVTYYILVSIFVRLAHKPPDEEHPYGHRQLESIAALTVGAFVITTAIALFWDTAGDTYLLLTGRGAARPAALYTLWVALATVLVKIGLTAFTLRIGRQTKNAAVVALAHDHRNDVFSALAVTVGITLGRFGYAWVDPLAGAIVALVIFRTGLAILHEAVSDLMDAVPGDVLKQQILDTVRPLPGVRQVEEIHAHRFGPFLVVNVTVGIDGGLTVSQGDAIAEEIEAALLREVEYLRRVHVHYHPATDANPAL